MRLGATIPNFSVETTVGPIDLYNWQGDSCAKHLAYHSDHWWNLFRWSELDFNGAFFVAFRSAQHNGCYVLLLSHPADFTPVCTTELGQLALHSDDFIKRNVKLLGHSVDSVQSHLEWIKDINSYCVNLPNDFPYPIIADQQRDLAVQLGMLDDDQKDDPNAAVTVRALYIIGPDHKIRLSMMYPHGTGRSVEEILRCVDSVQLTDRIKNIVTPANWTPRSEVMILPTVPEDDIRRLFPRAEIRCPRLPSGRRYLRCLSNYN